MWIAGTSNVLARSILQIPSNTKSIEYCNSSHCIANPIMSGIEIVSLVLGLIVPGALEG